MSWVMVRVSVRDTMRVCVMGHSESKCQGYNESMCHGFHSFTI